jgi:hypothetical protein
LQKLTAETKGLRKKSMTRLFAKNNAKNKFFREEAQSLWFFYRREGFNAAVANRSQEVEEEVNFLKYLDTGAAERETGFDPNTGRKQSITKLFTVKREEDVQGIQVLRELSQVEYSDTESDDENADDALAAVAETAAVPADALVADAVAASSVAGEGSVAEADGAPLAVTVAEVVQNVAEAAAGAEAQVQRSRKASASALFKAPAAAGTGGRGRKAPRGGMGMAGLQNLMDDAGVEDDVQDFEALEEEIAQLRAELEEATQAEQYGEAAKIKDVLDDKTRALEGTDKKTHMETIEDELADMRATMTLLADNERYLEAAKIQEALLETETKRKKYLV